MRCVATGIQPAATVRFHTVVAHDGQLITSTFNRPSASVLFRGVWNLESYAIQRRDDNCHTFAPRRSTIKLRAQRFDPMSLGELQDEGERADVQLDRWTHVALSLSLSLSLSLRFQRAANTHHLDHLTLLDGQALQLPHARLALCQVELMHARLADLVQDSRVLMKAQRLVHNDVAVLADPHSWDPRLELIHCGLMRKARRLVMAIKVSPLLVNFVHVESDAQLQHVADCCDSLRHVVVVPTQEA